MRPAGEIRAALWGGLQEGPGTTRELVQRTGVGVAAARWTLDNMCRAGVVEVVQEVRVPGVRRPVPVYGPTGQAEPARRQRADGPHAHTDWTLVRCWAQFPTTA